MAKNYVASLLLLGLTIIGCNASPQAPAVPPSEPGAQVATKLLPSPTVTAPVIPVVQGIGDPTFPTMGNPGYDVLHYDIALTMAVPNHPMAMPVINSTVTTTLRLTEDQEVIAFDFDTRSLQVDQVSVMDQAVPFTHTDRKLFLFPSKEIIKASSVVTAVISYHGIPSADNIPTFDTIMGWNRYRHGYYTFNVPNGASSWFPCNDHPRDKASYTFRITVPSNYQATVNGDLLAIEESAESHTFIWHMSDPLATYLAALVIAEQNLEDGGSVGSIQLRSVLPTTIPENELLEARENIARLPEMITFLQDRFGPYPFSTYGVVLIDEQIDAINAMEHSTMALFSRDRLAQESTVIHELAHEWFGNSVSLVTWQETWLKEGPATYAEWLWEAQQYGDDFLNTRIERVYQNTSWEQFPPLRYPPADNLLNEGVYLRGALTLHALRVRVGDEQFFRILQTFASRYRHANASTDDFIAVAEEVSGQQLDDFFSRWLEQQAIPPISELGVLETSP